VTYPAAQIPETGYTKSAWHRLDEMSRMLLLEETLNFFGAGYFVDGRVNYEDSREPLITERSTGMKVTIAGEIVQKPGDPLVVSVGGYAQPKKAAFSPWLLVIFATLVIGFMKK